MLTSRLSHLLQCTNLSIIVRLYDQGASNHYKDNVSILYVEVDFLLIGSHTHAPWQIFSTLPCRSIKFRHFQNFSWAIINRKWNSLFCRLPKNLLKVYTPQKMHFYKSGEKESVAQNLTYSAWTSSSSTLWYYTLKQEGRCWMLNWPGLPWAFNRILEECTQKGDWYSSNFFKTPFSKREGTFFGGV